MKKNRLDEMQEQRLLKIEHNGCWLSFWGLLAVIVVQMFFYDTEDWYHIAGEWFVFMCLALYLLAACLKNGLWDRRSAPTPQANLQTSSVAGLAGGLFYFGVSYKNYHKIFGSIATGIFIFLFLFTICYFALILTSKIYKKRYQQLENKNDE